MEIRSSKEDVYKYRLMMWWLEKKTIGGISASKFSLRSSVDDEL